MMMHLWYKVDTCGRRCAGRSTVQEAARKHVSHGCRITIDALERPKEIRQEVKEVPEARKASVEVQRYHQWLSSVRGGGGGARARGSSGDNTVIESLGGITRGIKFPLSSHNWTPSRASPISCEFWPRGQRLQVVQHLLSAVGLLSTTAPLKSLTERFEETPWNNQMSGMRGRKRVREPPGVSDRPADLLPHAGQTPST